MNKYSDEAAIHTRNFRIYDRSGNCRSTEKKTTNINYEANYGSENSVKFIKFVETASKLWIA